MTTLFQALLAAGYTDAPDTRLPMDYMAVALEHIAPVSHRIVEGTLEEVKNGTRSAAALIEEGKMLEDLVTTADTDAENELTPILQPLTKPELLLVTGEEGLKAAEKANNILHQRYEAVDYDMIGVLDPVDGTMQFAKMLRWAQSHADAVKAGETPPPSLATPGQPFGYATGYTMARRERDPDTGEDRFDPIASIVYWPDIKRFALIQPEQGVFEGAYDPATNTFSDVKRIEFKPANENNGVVLAPDVGLIMPKKHMQHDGIQEVLPETIKTAYPQVTEGFPVCANDVVWRYLRAAELGQVFLGYYDYLCKFWDKAHGLLISRVLNKELGQGAGAIAKGKPDFNPWDDRSNCAVMASRESDLGVLRRAYLGESGPLPPKKKA